MTLKEAFDLAVKKHQEGLLSEAKEIYLKILEKDSVNSDVIHLLGVIDHQEGRYEDAVERISEAIRLKEGDEIYHYNLAMAYDALGEDEKAADNFEKVLEINLDYNKAHIAHYNLGVFYSERGQIKEALKHYDEAVFLDSAFYDARWNRALCLLLQGNFEEGWKEYHCRFKKKSPTDTRVFDKPEWEGEALEGKTLLVLSEQGFGDNIQFVRYLSKIEGRVVLECRDELRALFEKVGGVDEFVEREKGVVPNVEFDYYIHLMDLPRVFGTTGENIPAEIPYLKADDGLVEKFREGMDGDFKVGIVWAGNPEQASDKNRSVEFEMFRELRKIPGVSLFSLQKGEASKQIDVSDVVDMGAKIKNFSDTAAIIENLDLIISVDTSVAHLAGAMGKPTWVLLGFLPDWRWFLGREDSPWYPGMKLFRQRRKGDWKGVFENVKRELGKIRD